jgi:hypothetical protein
MLTQKRNSEIVAKKWERKKLGLQNRRFKRWMMKKTLTVRRSGNTTKCFIKMFTTREVTSKTALVAARTQTFTTSDSNPMALFK